MSSWGGWGVQCGWVGCWCGCFVFMPSGNVFILVRLYAFVYSISTLLFLMQMKHKTVNLPFTLQYSARMFRKRAELKEYLHARKRSKDYVTH